MGERFTWRRRDDGFIALPEGDARLDRYCVISPWKNETGSVKGQWLYSFHCDGRSTFGRAASRQAAADCANLYWPAFLDEIRLEDEKAEAERAFRELVAALEGDETQPISALGLPAVDGALLLRVMRDLGDGRVRVAMSAELFRRRTR